MPTALFINGVYKATLTEIEKAQQAKPGLICYLQPYAAGRIKLLAEAKPTPATPIPLYASLTTNLNEICFTADIVGWEDKRELTKNPQRLDHLNQHIKTFQPSEVEIVQHAKTGKSCTNLLSVRGVTRYETPFSTSRVVKASDGKPLKRRSRAGGWCSVRELPAWTGMSEEALKRDFDESLEEAVARSAQSDSTARKSRLDSAPRVPQVVQVVSKEFRRNPDVIAEVLFRAKGICEGCKLPAPFLRASDNSPYLEVHHKKMLSVGGEDTIENAIALCPNCHRRFHFGKVCGST